MGWYVPTTPPADLERYIVCSWTASPSGTHRLVPDGCIDLLWTSVGQIWLCGPETSSWTFALPQATTAVGVRFRPGVGAALFGIDASTIRDQRIGVGDQSLLCTRIMLETTPTNPLHALERFVAEIAKVARTRAETNSDLRFAEAVVHQLTGSPRSTQRELADLIGLNVRNLHRRSLRCFGYGTATLSRLLRFQRFQSIAEATRSSAPGRPFRPLTALATLAIESGYSDHAHLVRDCRAITSQTPSQFLADYFPTFPDMSDPYKTAQPFDANMVE